jgi:hypothetical protein
LKKRELKLSVGTMWEYFCKDWLLAQEKYDKVWTLKEWHEYCEGNEVEKGLVLGKKDIGIDLVAHSKEGYHAVQCKWKKKGKVTWAQLSTFVGLVSRSGPWVSNIVMTNGSGVMWKVRRLKKDKSLCCGTFSSTERLEWTRISGVECLGHRLDEEVKVIEEVVEEVKIDADKMRQARLARFATVNV